jgi:hypothetical protein
MFSKSQSFRGDEYVNPDSDYTHGHLTTFLHAKPILRRVPNANLRATCLRNSGSWQTVEDYLADYNQIPDTSTLESLTQVQILIRENPQLPCPMADLHILHLIQSRSHPFTSRLPRKKFTKWFGSTPYFPSRPTNDTQPDPEAKIIFSPLSEPMLPAPPHHPATSLRLSLPLALRAPLNIIHIP